MKLLQRATLVTGLLLVCGRAMAPPQATLRHKTFQDFQNGEAKNVAVIGTGALELGPRFDLYKAMEPEAFVWALVADSQGRVYVGTGNDGKVFVLEGGKANAKAALATDDLEVLSLAVDSKDNVYAACAPSGKIYRIPRRGKPALFCETKQAYVWALAVTAKGDLYAGTGPEGKILKISAGGKKVETVHDSNDKHVLSLAAVGETVYAGTNENGLVYRIAPNGKVSIAFDAPQKELRCMAADKEGNVYFGTADGVRPAPSVVPRRGPAPKVIAAPAGGMATTLDVKKNARTSKRPPAYVPSKRPGPSAVSAANYVYRLSPDGKVTTVFRMLGVAFLSMVSSDGRLYVGTAGKGEVLRITSERDVALIAQQEQPQILSLCATATGKLFVGTGNDGRVYVADSPRAKSGTYTSAVYDARFRSSWGAFQLEGRIPKGTRVQFSTRSGNSEKPDKTWSDWTKPQQVEAGVRIVSPPARLIQYRLTLSSRDAKLTPHIRAVHFPYLVQNYAPSIDSIDVSTVVKSSPKSQKKPAGPPPPRGQADGCIAGTVTVAWKASDPNRDSLEYELFFRGKGEKNWKLLKDKLAQATHAWDTEAVPDGVYELKVRASDRPDNPPPRTLTDELVSDPVTVDNSPPVVRIVRTDAGDGKCSVESEVKDAGSNVTSARYSVDAGPWLPVLPVDQIFDAGAEKLKLTTKKLEPGEHTLVIQAEDSSGNVGSAKTVFEIPNK